MEDSDIIEVDQRPSTSTRDQNIAMEVHSKMAALVKIASGLPKRGDDYELCNSFSMFNSFMQQQELRLQNLLLRCMETSGCPVRAPKAGSSITDYMDRIIRANDAIVERAGICMDEIERSHRDEDVAVPKAIVGAESTKAMSVRQTRIPNSTLGTASPGNLPELLKAVREQREQMKAVNLQVSRPQTEFNIQVDNSRDPFISKLTIKHNARAVPKRLKIVDLDDPDASIREAEEDMELMHPYRVELDHFQIPKRQLESAAPIKYKSLDDMTLVYINTKEGLESFRDILNNEKEFAVDLEHNDTRTFLGLTCLIQISTRDKDYIIDPFPIWDKLHILNDPFTNPQILKVFHGADLDCQWLQRDFGIHVVNMFDTYHAMKRLELTKFSLQFLVQTYCDITLSKQYQTSDWRIRPLSHEQLEYARRDTHYLLYCYDRCREDLLIKGNEFKNLLKAVYSDSVAVCGKPYEKPVFDPSGYEHLLNSKRTFNSQQVYALKELWKWRDNVARHEDEGINYVLPNHMMLYIAEALPREAQGIAACCNPVPEMVKKHVLEIHKIVYAARDQPLILGFVQKKKIIGEEGTFLQAIIDEQNRMTKVKSILSLDFSFTRHDEEIGKIVLNSKEIVPIPEKALKESFFSFLDHSENVIFIPQAEVPKVDIQREILNDMEQWATPFERYSIGVKKAAEQEAKKKEDEERIKKEAGVEEKRRFTHHDPVNERPSQTQNKSNEDNIELSKDTARFTDDQILSKKALARKRKQARKAADIKFNNSVLENNEDDYSEPEEGEVEDDSMTYAREKLEDGTSTKKAKIEPVDYSQYNEDMFNKKPSVDTFDPFHQHARLEKKKNQRRTRGRGGFHRISKQSTRYMPGQQ